MKNYIVFVGIGFELLGIILVSIYLGEIIDKTYQTKGLGLIALMFIGLASWLTHVVLLLRRLEKNNTDDKKE